MDDFVPRFARPEDRPALSRLWLALETECLGAAPDGFPVSMLLLLPQRYAAAGRSLPVQYIYAAATLPAYRGRGYCGALLKAAFEVGRSRGQAASFLRPASQGLTDYYTQFGYRPFFGFLERRKPLSNASVRVPGLELFPVRDYGAARERVLADGPPHIGKNGGRIWRWSRPRRPAAEVFPLPGPLGARSATPTGTRCLSGSFSAPPLRQMPVCPPCCRGSAGPALSAGRPSGRQKGRERCSAFGVLWTMTDGNSSGPLRGINRIWGWR